MADDDTLDQFLTVTGASRDQAQFYLDSTNGDVQLAISTFFDQQTASGQVDQTDMQSDDDNRANQATASQAAANMPGAFTLGGSTAPSSNPRSDSQSDTQANSTSSSQGLTTAGGAYMLSGQSAGPMPVEWSSSSSSRPTNARDSSSRAGGPSSGSGGPRVASLRDFAPSGSSSTRGGGGRIGRIPHNDGNGDDGDGDGDDDSGEGKDPLEYFAGGEKSGLSLQNPSAGPSSNSPASDVVKGILRQAVEGTNRLAALRHTSNVAGVQPLLNVFRGSGHTLGSEEEPSKLVPDPEASSEDKEVDDDDPEETAVRNLTFWEDGFSIEDGDLMRYDDPANAGILAAINSGRAPLSLLNVRHDQPVELRIAKRLQEKWTRQAPAPKKAFEGQGHRLGSDTPTFVESNAAPVPSTTTSNPAQTESKPFEVDQTQPTTQLQIRLRDGSRMVARFNHAHTVGDIRRYINASTAGQSANRYVLQTTFPSRELNDDQQTIKDANLLGSVIVQKSV
ncbi:protein phosphatase regulator [Microbotryomycetes sp. JL221]|nr:protein phosphatase regulator [Microbotryomycetes sp. JL221]